MEIFNPVWNFNSVYRVKISSRLNSKHLFQVTLQLYVKISTHRYNELKFQIGLANPRWNFNPGWKFKISHIMDIFPNPGRKFDTTYAWIPCLFFKKIKMATSQARFKWIDDKLVNLIKCLREFKRSMEFRNCNSNADKVKVYENVRKRLNRYI